MANTQPLRIKTITDYHRIMGLPKPEHPLVSVINLETIPHPPGNAPINLVFDFYSISLKRDFNAKIKYGQQQYDFDEGIMFFISPDQVFGIEVGKDSILKNSGWSLLVHPDFLWNTPLAKTINQYEYFDYSVHEALFLSDKEEIAITGIMQNIAQEYHSNIDRFSQNVIIAQLELLFTYAERFYNRQFITRKVTNHQILNRLEKILTGCFTDETISKHGLPTVAFLAESLNLSPTYFSGLLKSLTGLSPQQHLHNKLIERAKEQLSTTNLTVSEIAYQLGFERSQSFNKLFKSKTQLSPLKFRQSFN